MTAPPPPPKPRLPNALVADAADDLVAFAEADCVPVTTNSPGVSPVVISVMVSFDKPTVTGTMVTVTSLSGTVSVRLNAALKAGVVLLVVPVKPAPTPKPFVVEPVRPAKPALVDEPV